jgi:hypothetical protein
MGHEEPWAKAGDILVIKNRRRHCRVTPARLWPFMTHSPGQHSRKLKEGSIQEAEGRSQIQNEAMFAKRAQE